MGKLREDVRHANTNLIHNILNILIALAAALSLPEVHAIFSPEVGLMIAGIAATMKTVLNVLRDGLAGLYKPQPPID